MIYLVLKNRSGEPDILSQNKTQPLIIRDQFNAVFKEYPAPPYGWTERQLVEVVFDIRIVPASAWLGEQWIGSTEV